MTIMPQPQTVYSVNHRLGGGGMGSSVLEMLIGLYEAGLLKQVIVSSSRTTRLPASLITAQGLWGRAQKRLSLYDPSKWVANYLESCLFDWWASRVMKPAEIFSSWTGIALTSLQIAHARGWRTILGLGSAHPRTVSDLMNTERQRWELPPLRETPFTRRIERELALADRVIVQSRFSERSLIAQGVPPDKLIRIPLGVDVRRFQPAASKAAQPFRVLFLGQVMLRKGVQYLLEAWRQLDWRDAELWVVGNVLSDGQLVLKRYANLPGLRVMGHVPDQLAAFQSADVFVAPSVEDGFGLTVTEAMACGLPVIVSDHVGAADLVVPGESGFVVPYDNIAGYVTALETLRANPDRARQMGQAGRAAVVNQTWDVYRQALVNCYLTG